MLLVVSGQAREWFLIFGESIGLYLSVLAARSIFIRKVQLVVYMEVMDQ